MHFWRAKTFTLARETVTWIVRIHGMTTKTVLLTSEQVARACIAMAATQEWGLPADTFAHSKTTHNSDGSVLVECTPCPGASCPICYALGVK